MLDNIKGVLIGAGGIAIVLGYTLGPIFGLYAAVTNGSFLNACLSLFIPWYGMFYWVLS